MVRRRRSDESSLELLLDTICNTFGGVLFIAILVVILLQQRVGVEMRDEESKTRPTELLALKTEHDGLQEAIKKLAESVQRFGDLATDNTVLELEELRRQLDNSLSLRDRAYLQRSESVSKSAAVQLEMDDLAARSRSLSQSLAVASGLHQRAGQRLTSAITSRQRVIAMPKLHGTLKHEHPFCLRYGRLYRVAVRDHLGRLDLDRASVDVKPIGTQMAIQPRPDAGLILSESPQVIAQVRSMLGQVDGGQEFATVFVWNDSFAEFQAVRQQLDGLGLEYRLVPLGPDAVISESSVPQEAILVQ